MSLYPAKSKKQADAQQAQLLQDVKVLRQQLNHDTAGLPVSQGQPILVVLCGLPGTGKTYFAREVSKHVPFCVLESDRVRKALVPKPKYTPGEHSRVFNACHYLIDEYLSNGLRVLFDATNLTEKFRLPLRQISQRQNARLVLVHLVAPRLLIRQRLQGREELWESGMRTDGYSDAGWLIYCRMAPYEEPVEGAHLWVDTSEDISSTVDDVVRLATAIDY